MSPSVVASLLVALHVALQIGFVVRTRQGRQAIRPAYEHLKLPPPADAGPSASEGELLF